MREGNTSIKTIKEKHPAKMRNRNCVKACKTEIYNELSSALADYVHDRTIDENAVNKIDVLTSLLKNVLVNELGVDGSEVGKCIFNIVVRKGVHNDETQREDAITCASTGSTTSDHDEDDEANSHCKKHATTEECGAEEKKMAKSQGRDHEGRMKETLAGGAYSIRSRTHRNKCCIIKGQKNAMVQVHIPMEHKDTSIWFSSLGEEWHGEVPHAT